MPGGRSSGIQPVPFTFPVPTFLTTAPRGKCGEGPTFCTDPVLTRCTLEGRRGDLDTSPRGGWATAGFHNTLGSNSCCHGEARENASWQLFPGTRPSQPPDHPGVPFPPPPLPTTSGITGGPALCRSSLCKHFWTSLLALPCMQSQAHCRFSEGMERLPSHQASAPGHLKFCSPSIWIGRTASAASIP